MFWLVILGRMFCMLVKGMPTKSSNEHFPKTNAIVTLMDIAGKTW